MLSNREINAMSVEDRITLATLICDSVEEEQPADSTAWQLEILRERLAASLANPNPGMSLEALEDRLRSRRGRATP